MHLVCKTASTKKLNCCSWFCSFSAAIVVALLALLASPHSSTTGSTASITFVAAAAFLRPFTAPFISIRTKMSSSSVDEALFWNREAAAATAAASSSSKSQKQQQEQHQQPIVKRAKIISLADPNDKANEPLHKLLKKKQLPRDDADADGDCDADDDDEGFELLQIGTCLDDFDMPALNDAQANVVFVAGTGCPNVRETLAALCLQIPTLEWIHTRSAGIDFCTSPELQEWWNKGKKQHHEHQRNEQQQQQQQQQQRVMTNAKGQFSSTLAEYTLLACAYFAKDLPRLLRNKHDKNWDKYEVLELRGATMGIVGYGDIGQACAKLAKAYGMKVKALQRRQRRRRKQQRDNSNNKDDVYCDEIFYMDDPDNKSNKTALNHIFADSDYILCALPLTPETLGMIGKEQFDQVKPGRSTCFINVGRGPCVDEHALIAALQPQHDDSSTSAAALGGGGGGGRLRGAGLDVFSQEPLPKDSPLWTMDNVLLSPHNMDLTATFMEEATQFFVDVNLPRFVRGLPMLNPVNPVDGY
jgi:phosphoglycerate dehydrogenase-like enzyme